MKENRLKAKDYIRDKIEMKRRKVAFSTLLATVYLVSLAVWMDYIINYPGVFLPYFATVAALFLLLRSMFKRVIDKESKMCLCLSDTEMKRVNGGHTEHVTYDAIGRISIKRTLHNQIREIKIERLDSTPMFLNGFECMETLKEDLLNRIHRLLPDRDFKEFIDFDHPLYYVFFGALVSVVTSVLLRGLMQMDRDSYASVSLGISLCVIGAGIYLIVTKPVKGSYGSKGQLFDIGLGIVFIVIGGYFAVSAFM